MLFLPVVHEYKCCIFLVRRPCARDWWSHGGKGARPMPVCSGAWCRRIVSDNHTTAVGFGAIAAGEAATPSGMPSMTPSITAVTSLSHLGNPASTGKNNIIII